MVRLECCLNCGCDGWYEFKNGLRITTSQECSCYCHWEDKKDCQRCGKLVSEHSCQEKKECWIKQQGLDIANKPHSIQKNKIYGRLAQLYSQHDFIENGFVIRFVNGRGYDFVAWKITSDLLFYVVEVKYNKSHLSKLQKLFRYYCRRSKINYFVYRVTQDQLHYWLNKRDITT